MRRRRTYGRLYAILGGGQWLSGLLLVAISASLKADPNRLMFGEDILLRAQSNASITLPLLTILVGALGLGRKMLGPPWLWETVHEALNVLRDHVFADRHGDPVHYHRATLFKHRRWGWWRRLWSFAGWLVPVERSGYTTLASSVIFRAPENDPDRAEGVAGQAWSRNEVVAVAKLPDLARGTDADYQTYSSSTWVSVPWLRDKKPTARSLCGIPVEVGGKPWGVIVLDSRSPEPISEEEYGSIFQMFAGVLSKPLQKV